MNNPLSDYLLLAVAMGVGFYTLTYARWLWTKKYKPGALGIAALAALCVLYPGFVLFFVHK